MKIFESADDRDGTITMWMVFILLCVVLYVFKEKIQDEAGFVVGTLLGYFGAIVQKFFKKEGNGIPPVEPPEPKQKQKQIKPFRRV